MWCGDRVLPESPRWLLATGQVEKTARVLEDAARFNRITLPTNIDKILKQVSNPPNIRFILGCFSTSRTYVSVILHLQQYKREDYYNEQFC